MAVSPAGRFLAIDPCGNAPGTTSVCPPPEDDGEVEVEDEEAEVPPVPPVVAATGADGTCDLNDSRATRPAMVPVTARIARRMTRFSPQNWNDSKWMCRRGTPAARSARTAAEVMPAGPQTYASCWSRPGTRDCSTRGDSGSPRIWARDPTR